MYYFVFFCFFKDFDLCENCFKTVRHQQQMRLPMHQYRPGPPTMADSPHLSADPNMLNYQYSANTNANNSNILMSSSQQQQYHQHQFNSKPPNYPHL